MNRIAALSVLESDSGHRDLLLDLENACCIAGGRSSRDAMGEPAEHAESLDVRSVDHQVQMLWTGNYTTPALAIGRCRLLPNQKRALAMQQVIVGLHAGPTVALKWCANDGGIRFSEVVAGNLYVATAEHPLWLSWSEPIEMFMIAIEREYFDAVRGNFGLDHVDVATGVFTADISLGQIVNLFQHVMEEEALATQAYLDSIASVLITYLLKSRDLSEEFGESGRLSAVQLQRVVTYVERHLSKTISLRELAETAGLSLHHFATAFRKTTGGTPHRYVVDRKIAYARMLLADRHITIPDVAARLGFASQSHFTQQFRRSTGTTPGRYRRNLR